MRTIRRAFWGMCGLLALILGTAGAILPVLPTTPFLLAAVFAFGRSSSRLHEWMICHRQFGPLIENWRRSRAIDRRAKLIALLIMPGMLAASFVVGASCRVLLLQVSFLLPAAIFILSRPDAQVGRKDLAPE